MANTQNLDLVKPLGTDYALVSVLNSNSDKIDAYAGAVNASLDGLRDGLGILANGNTHAAITSGQYVYVKNHGSLPEGLYKATANIAANGTLSTTNLAADSAGGLNSLNEQIGTLNSKIAKTDYSIFNYIAQNITRMRGKIVKMNNIVFIEGRWEGNATNSDDILILPSELRPSSIMYGSGVIYSSSGLASAEYVINTNGTLRQAQVAGNTTNGSFVFIYVI